MIIELMLATALNMSLPEFQPETDISGNVIVSEIDDVSGDSIAIELPLEEIPIEEISFEENETMLRAIETHVIDSTLKSGWRYSGTPSALQQHSASNLYYVYLTAGIEYTLSINTGGPCSSLEKGAVVTMYDQYTITPETNCYYVKTSTPFTVTYTTGEPDNPLDVPSGNDPDDPSGNDPNDPSGNDPIGTDYTDLINAVNRVNESVNVCAYILLFMAFCPFITKIVDKLMFRKED